MAHDPRVDPPDAKPTKQLPAMTDRALLEDLAREVRATRSEVTQSRADIQLVSNDLGILKQRVSIIEGLRTEDALRAAKLSGGVRGLSQSDAGQKLEIASLSVKVDDLAKSQEVLTKSQDVQLAILTRLDKLASNPSIKIILTVAATAAASWAASKGLK